MIDDSYIKDVKVNYDYWSRQSYWQIDEIICLVVGLEPKLLKDGLDKFVQKDKLNEFNEKLGELSNTLLRARQHNDLGDQNKPEDVIKFLSSKNIRLPEKLMEAIAKNRPGFVDWQKKYQEAESELKKLKSNGNLKPRETNSLLKMVIGMAMAYHGHDPKASRSKATQEIVDELLRVGIKIEADTVRKWLAEAAKTIDN